MVASLLIVALGGAHAVADERRPAPPGFEYVCVVEAAITGGCRVWVLRAVVSDGGESASDKPRADRAEAPEIVSGPRVCEFQGREVPCNETAGTWSHAAQAWCRRLNPQPPLTDPAWENNTDGAVYLCTRPGGSLIPDPALSFTRWLADSDAAPLPDPETVARQLLAQLNISAVDIGLHPRGDSTERMSVVGWNMWLWADSPASNQWGSLSNSSAAGGLSVSLTADAREIVWDMGNGDTITCGPGTAWTMSATGGRNVESPDCGYVYGQRGTYTVTATTSWDVAWQGGGQSGTLPLEVARSVEVIVGELQSVNVKGS